MTDIGAPDTLNGLVREMCRLHYSRARVLLNRIGLYRGQPPMLRALLEQEGLSHSELAARLRVKPSTITRMIQRMERAGFVERRQAAENLRERTEELEAFNEAMVDRESRVIELKEEVNRLARELGREEPYEAVWEDEDAAAAGGQE